MADHWLKPSASQRILRNYAVTYFSRTIERRSGPCERLAALTGQRANQSASAHKQSSRREADAITQFVSA
ncbi:hypothetical protein AU192_04010 [Mycobacterium lehmannii]|uniref:Uncharacterized protein n=1 Tax=Mycobacterium lehmannii TaxID=2048550 RepID=A0A101A9I9_9MYCO|nr:hypothetical protein AU192_04010 [Mycobacterium lehmannii]